MRLEWNAFGADTELAFFGSNQQKACHFFLGEFKIKGRSIKKTSTFLVKLCLTWRVFYALLHRFGFEVVQEIVVVRFLPRASTSVESWWCRHPAILLSYWLTRESAVDAVDIVLPARGPCEISNGFVVLSIKLLFRWFIVYLMCKSMAQFWCNSFLTQTSHIWSYLIISDLT